MDVFENGVQELNDKGLDEKVRGAEEEKQVEKPKCGACGFSMPIGADTCPACGHKRVRRSMVEAVAGTMVLVGTKMLPATGKHAYLADRDAVWRQLCALALDRKGNDVVLAQKYAQAKYISIYGEFAKRRIDPTVVEQPCRELVNRITHDNIAYARRRAA
jgi:DNA repair protein RadD